MEVDDDASVSSLEMIRRERKTKVVGEVGESSLKQKCEKEWHTFKNEGDFECKDCPLLWWRMNTKSYPTLAILARQFLAVQASSAPF